MCNSQKMCLPSHANLPLLSHLLLLNVPEVSASLQQALHIVSAQHQLAKARATARSQGAEEDKGVELVRNGNICQGYRWTQELSELSVSIDLPPGTAKRDVVCKFSTQAPSPAVLPTTQLCMPCLCVWLHSPPHATHHSALCAFAHSSVRAIHHSHPDKFLSEPSCIQARFSAISRINLVLRCRLIVRGLLPDCGTTRR